MLGAYIEVEKTTGGRFLVPPSLSCVSCVSWFRIRITPLAIWLRLGRTVFRGAIFRQGDLADDRAGREIGHIAREGTTVSAAVKRP